MIVCDTGPIVAAALEDDAHHHECVELFTAVNLARRPLPVPKMVVAEVGYLRARNAGPELGCAAAALLPADDSCRSIVVTGRSSPLGRPMEDRGTRS